MPITIEAGYEKKLDLPRRYCNQTFFLSVRVTVGDDADVNAEGARLHKKLQRCVDRQLKKVGYLPGESGDEAKPPARPRADAPGKLWSCDDAQRDVIIALVERRQLEKSAVDNLAKSMHGVGVRSLCREQATTFIEQLVKWHGTPPLESEIS